MIRTGSVRIPQTARLSQGLTAMSQTALTVTLLALLYLRLLLATAKVSS